MRQPHALSVNQLESLLVQMPIQPQLTRFTRFLCLPSRIVFVKWLTLSNLRESGVRTFAWKALLPGVYGFVFFTHVLQVGPTIIVVSASYHVSQMTLCCHGEEQATRELLLPLFEHWTYTSLEAMQQASLEPAYGLLLKSTIRNASPVSGSCPAVSPPDMLGLGEATVSPAAPPGLVPANQGNNVSAPTADMCNGGLNEATLTSLNLLPRLVEQLVRGQSLLHEALSSLSDRLDHLRPFDGHPPLAVPAQASRHVTSCAPFIRPHFRPAMWQLQRPTRPQVLMKLMRPQLLMKMQALGYVFVDAPLVETPWQIAVALGFVPVTVPVNVVLATFHYLIFMPGHPFVGAGTVRLRWLQIVPPVNARPIVAAVGARVVERPPVQLHRLPAQQ